jgi:hypothetical protein
LPGQDCQDRTASTGLPGQDCKDRTVRKRQLGQDSPDRTARTGLFGTGLPGHGCQDRTVCTGLPGHGCRDRTARALEPGLQCGTRQKQENARICERESAKNARVSSSGRWCYSTVQLLRLTAYCNLLRPFGHTGKIPKVTHPLYMSARYLWRTIYL